MELGRRIAIGVAALVFALASGCNITAGRDFDSQRVPSIQVGTTRRTDIEAWFGLPYQRTVMAPTEKSGVRRYVYAYAERGSADTDVVGKSLIVDFDAEDRVVDMRYTEQGSVETAAPAKE
jgi:outer membrane protein assembly factor BamE (lipoprotein component of BamABCDE complex)